MRIILSILIVIFSFGLPNGINAQVTRSITKSVSKCIGKKEKKSVLKVVSKGVLKEIPVGKASLRTIKKADGSIVPEIHNLGKNSSKYSDEFNKLILKERRKAITWNHQLIPSKNLINSKRIGNLNEAPSTRKLRENMYARMGAEEVNVAKAFGGTEAHHVIEGSDKAASKSREILKKFKIGINDAENGVLLPEDERSIYKGAIHKTNHSDEYSLYVYNKIKNVKTQEELIYTLTEIKRKLINGSLSLDGKIKKSSSRLVF
ncbi:MAG: AHH domain-containing protein [Muribaculaceae bacterium]|nr:AHH domain-containing protein [Muribaculaceae bacterium]